MRLFDPLKLLILFFVISIIVTKINGLNPRKLDENTVPVAPGEKCTTCCSTCTPSPPPPSPPPPSPPPPPKKPPKPYCPPPPVGPGQVPPPSFIYITGPPGNLYPVDQYFSGAGRNFVVRALPLLVSCALFGLLGFW